MTIATTATGQAVIDAAVAWDKAECAWGDLDKRATSLKSGAARMAIHNALSDLAAVVRAHIAVMAVTE